MKQRPILFSTPMVKAILEGRKTQTRRVVDISPILSPDVTKWGYSVFTPIGCISARTKQPTENGHTYGEKFIKLKYGKPGDVIWVKESYFAFGEWMKNGKNKTGKQKWSFKRHWDADIQFKEPGTVMPNTYRKPAWYKRSSLFMEKDFARIWLKITDIRVERLQDISEEDVIREGAGDNVRQMSLYGADSNQRRMIYCNSFMNLWQSINGEESWKSNPWVWVVSFQKIDKPE